MHRSPAVAVIGAILLVLGGCAAPGSSITPTTTASTPAGTPAGPSTLTSTTDETDVAPPGAIEVTMGGPPPRFTPSEITASVGTIVFFLTNVTDAAVTDAFHSMAIGPRLDEPLASSRAVGRGRSAVFTVEDVPAGTYEIWCTIPGHAAAGMVGTLTVTP